MARDTYEQFLEAGAGRTGDITFNTEGRSYDRDLNSASIQYGENSPLRYLKAYLLSIGQGGDATSVARNLGFSNETELYAAAQAGKLEGLATDYLKKQGIDTSLFDQSAANVEYRPGQRYDASGQLPTDLGYTPFTPTTGSTTTSNPQNTQQMQGFSLSGNNLRIGSTGDDVKNLQTYLKGIGLYTGKIDGIFGPQTDSAVKSFQYSKGLTADGIVGPKTASAINSVQTGTNPSANTQAYNSPNTTGSAPTFNTGDPAQDALLKELRDFMKSQLDAGLKINPDLTFDSATLDKFLETAKKQVKPYYAQQIDTIKQDVLRTAPQILQEYGDTIKNEEAGFQNSLDTSRENFAGSGLAFSGQRAKGELGMQDAQNRNLSSLSTAYGNKIYELGRGAEERIGKDNMGFQLPSLSSYSASLGGNGGFNQGSPITSYQPGGYKIGSIENEREAAVEARRQALIKTASENVVAGRSYQDLFK